MHTSQKMESFHELSVVVPITDISFDENHNCLGKGRFGTMYQGSLKGLKVALKVSREKKSTKDVAQDFDKLCSQFIGASFLKQQFVLIREYSPATLYQIIHCRNTPLMSQFKSFDFNTELKFYILTQCCSAIHFIHTEMNTPHREIKSTNFLVDTTFSVKITDIRLNCLPHVHINQINGSIYHLAPEVWVKIENKSSDIYSMGVLMWELFYEKIPYESFNGTKEEFVNYITQKHDFSILFNGHNNLVNSLNQQCNQDSCLSNDSNSVNNGSNDIPYSVINVITSAISVNPSSRPDINKLVSQIDNCVLDYQLGNRESSTWWKKHFSIKGQDFESVVDVCSFVDALTKTHGVNLSVNKDILCEMLSEHNNISLPFFKFLTTIFGRFFKKKQLFLEMIETSQQPWFFNRCEKSIANSYLENKSDNTFLVRVSSTDPFNFPYTLSKRTNGKTVHTRIKRIEIKSDKYEYLIESRAKNYLADSLVKLIQILELNKEVDLPCTKDEENLYAYCFMVHNI
ncbi:Protein kinase [Entamoeba marina]